jgi:hypothetical protein
MSFGNNFTCDARAEQVLTLIKEVLNENLVEIHVTSFKLSENFETARAKIEAKTVEIARQQAKKINISGEGVGLVDACFDAFIKNYENDFCSLDSIAIADFSINAHLDRASKRRSDAQVTAQLRVKNAENYEYAFLCTTSSISHSSVAVVEACVAFFINAEIAYTQLYKALKDAKERARHDLALRFQNQMATLVHATSYEKVVAKLKGTET